MAIEPAVKPVELGGARAWLVWALAVTFVVYYFSFQTGYAIVNPSVQKDVGLSVAQVATVAAVYTWVFALCQFLSGALLDRLGAGKIIPISIALVTMRCSIASPFCIPSACMMLFTRSEAKIRIRLSSSDK